MQKTSELYREIRSGPHWWETVLAIGDTTAVLGTEENAVTFGNQEILLDTGGTDSGFREDRLLWVETDAGVFRGQGPEVGCCVAREIRGELLGNPNGVGRAPRMRLWVRCTDGQRQSEWLPKGVFYLDTRQTRRGDITAFTGFDGMLKLETAYPPSRLDWPARDIDAVHEICGALDMELHPETEQAIHGAYTVNYPGEYSCREFLGFIAGMYAGCFVLDDLGRLQLVSLADLAEERVLAAQDGSVLTVGGAAIVV